MSRFHITQDETGYFQLTFEDDEGGLQLVSYQSDSPKQLVEDAMEMAASGDFGAATVVVDPRKTPLNDISESAAMASARPAPRRAGE